MNDYFIIGHGKNKLGSIGQFELYLRDEGYSVTKLLHPLYEYSDSKSGISKNNISIPIKRFNIKGLNLLEDFLISIKLIMKNDSKHFIAITNVDALCVIFCRKLLRKKMESIIYYPRDYSENKFSSSMLNAVYRKVESVAVKYSDKTICNTHRAADARKKLGLQENSCVVLPNGVDIKHLKFKPKLLDRNQFIYIGEVSKEHGLKTFIDEYGQYINDLTIIGDGNEWQETISLCKTYKFQLTTYRILPHHEVIEKMKNFRGIGLAPYTNDEKWTYYCSPLKISEYIACNIPVVCSEVPEMASLIKHKKLGITYKTLNAICIYNAIKDFDHSNFVNAAKAFHDENNYKIIYTAILK